MKASLFAVLGLSALVFALLGACYDARSPNLPPCQKGAAWPDPCDGARPRDAGK